jgi:hypothetical protein
VSSSVHPLGADREDCPMLSWGGASDQIKNASSLAGDLSFSLETYHVCYLDWRVPSICVTELGVPNVKRDRLSV